MQNIITKIKNKILKAQSSKLKASGGFSFIELIVVVAIMLVVTSVVLLRQTQFSSDILITDMAYEVALAVRQAEVLGISSKGSGLATDPYRVGYGIHFNSVLAMNSPSSFLNFLDQPTNTISLEAGNNAEFNFAYHNQTNEYLNGVSPDVVSFSQGQKIHGFCGRRTDSKTWNCWWKGGIYNSSNLALNIVFVKPNPEAHITMGCVDDSGGISYTCVNGNVSYDAAKIIVESSLGDKCRTIDVSVSGQIGVSTTDPNDPTNGCGDVVGF